MCEPTSRFLPYQPMEVRKRKQRAILSCNDCRRRKLKCDRELPCNRCIVGGVAEKCAYTFPESERGDSRVSKRVRDASSQPSTDVRPVDTIQGDRVEHLERQVAELQALVRMLRDKPETQRVPNVDCAASNEPSALSVGLFKGKGYRTFYYGLTSPVTVVAHFPDLRAFMKRVFVGSTLQRLRQDFKAKEEKARAKQIANRVLTVPDLRSLLPGKGVVDNVVRTYFETFETTYRILHAPTFWAAYATFWDAPCEANSDMDAIVLSILACTMCTSAHETPRYNADGSTWRSEAIVWIKACDAWLRRQSNKWRTLASLQVRLLRLLALSTTCLKTKEYYQEVQAHVAFMVSSGMHRDPEILGSRCSVFEAEMRRRLWATTVELELQASIDRGTSSVLSSLQYDCAAPRNVNDSELHPDMKSLPDAHLDSAFTDASYLQFSLRSLSLRRELCAKANSHQPSPAFCDTLRDDQEILRALANIPDWNAPRALQASALLDLQLRQFLVILHTQEVFSTQLRGRSEHHYAMATTLEACETLISKHTKLLEANNFALCCLRFDYLRAALLICHVAYHASLASDTFVTRIAKPTFEATSPAALRLLEERSMRPGRGNHHYWYISAAVSLVTIQYEPHNKAALEKQASERVCGLLYRVLALQNEDGEGQPAEIILADVPRPSMNTPASFVDPEAPVQMPGFGLLGEDVGAGEGPAAGEWMLDDFWFLGGFLGGGGEGL